jgi:hypothetical protein
MVLEPDGVGGQDGADTAAAEAVGWGCRHVQARVPVNDAAGANVIAQLGLRGFVFQSFLPFGEWSETRQAFSDVVQLQWVAPEHRHAQWPEDTGAPPHVLGYPRGVVGAVVRAIRRQSEEQTPRPRRLCSGESS